MIGLSRQFGESKLFKPAWRGIVGKLFYALFGSKTTTLADGTRELVNSGTSATNGTLYSTKGLAFNGVDQYIDTMPLLIDKPYTFLYESGFQFNSNIFGKDRIRELSSGFLGVDARSATYGGGADVPISDTQFGVGDLYSAAIVIPHDGIVNTYINGVFDKSTLINTYGLVSQYIGCRLPGNEYRLGNIGYVYIIPQALTPQEVQQHYNNPERTLYWENGVLKSAFLPQSTIDDMQAGNGSWYPLTETTEAGGYARNHALPYGVDGVIDSTYATITNYADTMRTNPLESNKGYMPLITERDSFGLQTGLKNIDVKANNNTEIVSQFNAIDIDATVAGDPLTALELREL